MQNASRGVLYTALIGFGRFYCSLSRVLSIYLHWRGTFDVVLALYQRCTLKDDISYLLPT